ncbi:MAG: hypothetical protein ABSF29_10375 [Tepidisphaeraceae bacterium]
MQATQVVDSPIPRELLHSPRMVLRKRGTLTVLLLGRMITGPVLAIFAALVAFVVLEPIVVFVIPAQPARVIALWGDNKARHGIAYYVEYQLDRSGLIGRDQVLQNEFAAYHVGQAIKAHAIHLGKVGYAALDRSLQAYARYRLIDWFGAAVGIAVGTVLFYGIWLVPWRSHWLVKNGKATFGAIVAKSIICTGRRQCSFTLTYQFKAMGNLWARRMSINPRRYDSAALKDLVIVLFDPKRPKHSIVYDYCDFIAV